jgi:hypothetical protein
MYRLINNCSSIHNFDYVHLDPIATIFVEELHVFTKCLIDSLSGHTFEDNVTSSSNSYLSFVYTHTFYFVVVVKNNSQPPLSVLHLQQDQPL